MGLDDGVQSGLARLQTGGSGPIVAYCRLDGMDLPPPDFVKIDVEGHEAAAFEGMRHTLEKHKPMIVFENWAERGAPHITTQPFKVLRELGYDFFFPGWLNGPAAEPYLAAEPPQGSADEWLLALVPILPEQRFLLQDQINVFACHRDKRSILHDKFDFFP